MEYASEKMKIFNQNIEAKRPAELKPKEGEELTEEQKTLIAKQRQEESIEKFKEVEILIKEAPKYKFNVNVLKAGSKLALTED